MTTTPPTFDSAIPHSNNAMPDDVDETFAASFGPITPDDERLSDFLDMPQVEETEREYDQPDDGLLDKKKRSPKAVQYEKKTRGLFAFAFQMTVRSERTQADAATILMYGPDVAEAVGDLAAENAWAARAVDMLTDTTDNAAAALLMTATPFVLQLLRNHEPVAEVEPKGFKIPFTKRVIRVRFNLKLKRARKFTYPPETVVTHAFSNPAVAEKLRKQGINVILPG